MFAPQINTGSNISQAELIRIVQELSTRCASLIDANAALSSAYEVLNAEVDALQNPASTYFLVYDNTTVMQPGRQYQPMQSSVTSLPLPATCPVGSIFTVIGYGSGGWRVTQNAGQLIRSGSNTTTTGTGGYIASQTAQDCMVLRCTVANTEFVTSLRQGTLTVV